MKYQGHKKDASMELLQQNTVAWRVVQAADTLCRVFNGDQVKAWKVCLADRPCALKYWSEERLEEAATQVAAETQAMIKLRRSYSNHPLLVLPLQRFDNVQGGMFSISPYAGVAVSELRSGQLANISHDELLQECQTMAICLMRTEDLLQIKIKDPESREVIEVKQYLHKDIKPSNMCRSSKDKLYRLIDWGAFSSVDKTVWVDVCDVSYVTPEMTYYNNELRQFAVQSVDGMREATNNTTDFYLIGLAIMEFFLGQLPRQIDWANYDYIGDYLAGVWNFSWADYLEDVEMPADMKDWLLWVLSPDPAARPQSVQCAMGHKWIQQGLPRVDKAIRDAEGPWNDLVEGIKMDINDIISGCSSSPAANSTQSNNGSEGSSSCGAQLTTISSGVDCKISSSVTSSCTGKIPSSIGDDMCRNSNRRGTDSVLQLSIKCSASRVSKSSCVLSTSESFSCSTPSIRLSHLDGSDSCQDSPTSSSDSSSQGSNAGCSYTASAAAVSLSSSVSSTSTASSLFYDYPSIPADVAAASADGAESAAHPGCCCAAVAPQAPGVTSVSTQTTSDPSESDCAVHVMLLLVKEPADKSGAAAAAESPPYEPIVSSDGGEKFCCEHGCSCGCCCCCCSDSDPQLQQQLDASPTTPRSATPMTSAGSNASGSSSNGDTKADTSTGQGQKVKGVKSLKRAVKLQLRRACGFMSFVLNGLQHATHK